MTRALWTFVLAGLVATVGQGVRADAPKPKNQGLGRTLVLMVGINKYDDKEIKERKNAEADVKDLFEQITKNSYLTFDAKASKLLLGSAKGDDRATKKNFIKGLETLATEAKPNDTVIIAFAGNGGPLGDTSGRCYFLADSTFKNRAKDAVTPDEIEKILKTLKAKSVCAFVDVNFKGFKIDGKTTAALDELSLGRSAYREFLGDDGSEDHKALPGRVLFLATNGLNPSLDLKEHGLFAQVLLDGLKGGADNEGKDTDGLVTVDELARFVDKELPILARKHGTTKKEKEQDHFVLSGSKAHFVVGTVAKARAQSLADIKAFDALVKNGKIKGVLIEEGRSLLERTPTLNKRRELRKVYQELVKEKAPLTVAKFTEKRDKILEDMKLRDKDARSFALKVLQAIEILQDDYVDANKVKPGKLVKWAITALYNYADESIPATVETKLKKVDTFKALALMDLLVEARKALGQREDLEKERDLTVALRRMMNKLDPHTTYIDPETVRQFTQDIQGKFYGVGIHIRKDLTTDQLLVASPIKGSPAYKAGIQAGDLITAVIRDEDEKGNKLAKPEEISTKGMALSKAVKLIQGKEDTNVKLRIQRPGTDKSFVKEITRKLITVETVLGYKRDAKDDWNFYVDPKNKIGYIRLTSFSKNSGDQVEAAVKALKKTGLKGLVLDLRGNPGGLLDVAIKITDLFINDELIVSIRPRGGKNREVPFRGRARGSELGFPMACLINGRSASGSEIVSAALQDHARAQIFGERSYGKGSVQNIKEFGEGEIKLTTASFWRPSGKNLNKAFTSGKENEVWGVVPDKVVTFTAKEKRDLAEFQQACEMIERPDQRGKIKDFKDRQLEAALKYLRGEIKRASKATTRNNG